MTMTIETPLQRSFAHNHNCRMIGIKAVCLLLGFCIAGALTTSAQTVTTLVNFTDPFSGGGAGGPKSAPVQGIDGNFYGATGYGGSADQGTTYTMTPAGSLTILYDSSENTVAQPFANLLLTAGGNFYSTSFEGGPVGSGTFFEMAPNGSVTIFYEFCSLTNCLDGANPVGGLVLAPGGNFYGATASGGTSFEMNFCGDGCGTIFKMTPTGSLTTVYNFCSQPNCTDGAFPFGNLVQDADGNFYGTTIDGGTNNQGVVFKVTAAGKLTTLYSFCSKANCTDGAFPFAGLVQAANGNFYGTTELGGSSNQGTIFQITPAGKLATLHSFCSKPNCADGKQPQSALIQATDGNLYGTTFRGGATNGGTLFEITPAGKLTTLYNFCSQSHCSDGVQPLAALAQATNGILYGSTFAGGPSAGTIFSLSNGMAPFAQTVPPFGKVGDEITIIGNNLTGTSAVKFNGTSAAFTVVSDTEITATVPSGAASGTVKVSTPGGTLNSNVSFHVLH